MYGNKTESWYVTNDQWKGMCSSWRRMGWKESHYNIIDSNFSSIYAGMFSIPPSDFLFFSNKFSIWILIWTQNNDKKMKIEHFCIWAKNLKLSSFYNGFQILGICFAQNLRADIFAQKSKWRWVITILCAHIKHVITVNDSFNLGFIYNTFKILPENCLKDNCVTNERLTLLNHRHS